MGFDTAACIDVSTLDVMGFDTAACLHTAIDIITGDTSVCFNVALDVFAVEVATDLRLASYVLTHIGAAFGVQVSLDGSLDAHRAGGCKMSKSTIILSLDVYVEDVEGGFIIIHSFHLEGEDGITFGDLSFTIVAQVDGLGVGCDLHNAIPCSLGSCV